jgi:imidazolonepropionase-like amidohydrolase
MRLPQHPAAYDGNAAPQQASSVAYTGLRCNLLIPGRGDPIKHGALVIKDGKIDWVGEYSGRPSKYDAIKFTHVPVLMPGLWDCHVHFGGHGLAFNNLNDHRSFLPGYESLAGAITAADLKRTLEAGFTSVRELAGVRILCPP